MAKASKTAILKDKKHRDEPEGLLGDTKKLIFNGKAKKGKGKDKEGKTEMEESRMKKSKASNRGKRNKGRR